MENLSYLAFKLFGQADDYSMHTVSWAQFNRVCTDVQRTYIVKICSSFKCLDAEHFVIVLKTYVCV